MRRAFLGSVLSMALAACGAEAEPASERPAGVLAPEVPYGSARSARTEGTGAGEPIATPAPATITRDAPQPAPAPTPALRVVPLEESYFFYDGCWQARGPDAAEARRRCRERGRRGAPWERRACACEAEHLIEVRSDDPVAAWMGCCWGSGSTPEHAATQCAERIAERSCDAGEAGDRLLVRPITGPYERHVAHGEFDDVAVYRYLSPEGLWVTPEGEPPCFPEGTLVTLAEGTRPIEEVRVGDEVLAYDADGELVLAPVLRVKRRTSSALVTLRTIDGREVRATPEHPFYVPDERAWRGAGELGPGDALLALDSSGELQRVLVESRSLESAAVPVLTLTIGGAHTFFADGVLVHNY